MHIRRCVIAYRIKTSVFAEAVTFYGGLFDSDIEPQYYPGTSPHGKPEYAVFNVFDMAAKGGWGRRYQAQLWLRRVDDGDTEASPVVYWGVGDKSHDLGEVKRGLDYLFKGRVPGSAPGDEIPGPDPTKGGGKHMVVAEEMGSVVDPFGYQTGVTINPLWPKGMVDDELWHWPAAAAVVAIALTGFFAAFGLFSKRNR